MELLMLGPFELHRDGHPVELGDLQQRYTLAALALHANRPLSAERLIDIVWAGQVRPKTNLIPNYINGLRKALKSAGGDDHGVAILRTPTGYLLRIDPEYLDSIHFERTFGEATAAGRAGNRARQLTLLREAVGLWRGRFLEDLDIDRVGAAHVVSPEEAFFDAVGDLAELELAEENHRWVRDRLRPVVRSEPTRQRLAALLIRALLANGDRVPAMEVYHRTREALETFGMETTVELRRLAHLAQRTDVRGTLPPAPSRFNGRESELTTLDRLVVTTIGRNRPAVAWISGMPGVGKTALAVQAAHRLRKQLPDGQVFVQLNGFTPNVEPTGVWEALGRLLEGLGVPPEQVPRTTGQRIAKYQAALSGTRTLVVLDNAPSEADVQPLLPAVPGCLAIVTSRRIAGADADVALQLTPLPLAAAAMLFVELAGADRVRGQNDVVEEVVRRCGCLPLQVRIVASQFRLHRRWPLRHLAELLSQGRFDEAGAIACQVSYEQLSESQRRLFRLMGRAPGADLSVPAAAALAGCAVADVRDELDELHAASLVDEPSPERYVMLDPLKEYAGTLPDRDDAVEAATRLLDFYLTTTGAAIAEAFPFDRDRQPKVGRTSDVALEFREGQSARDWLEVEGGNLLAVIRYAASHDHPEHTWQLAVLLWRWHYARGQVEDWAETLELAQRTIEATGDRRGRAYVLLRLSGARRQAGKPGPALELAAKALSDWEHLGDVRGQAAALCAIAMVTMDQGKQRSAIAHYEAALEKYRTTGDERGQAHALGNLGQLNELRGNLTTAEEQHSAAADLLRKLGHTQGLAHTLDNLGLTRRRLGRLDEAMVDHETAYRLALEVGDRACEAFALTNIGAVHRLRNRFDEALLSQERARQVADTVGDPNLGTQLYLDRGATHLARKEYELARHAYFGALDLAAGTEDAGHRAHANHGAARVFHAEGRHRDAVRFWEAAEAGFGELGWSEAAEIHLEREQLGCTCASRQPVV